MGKTNKHARAFTKEIVKEYSQGTSAWKLGEKYGAGVRLIQNIVSENGGRIRGNMEAMRAKRTNTVNKSCFDDITDESAYWLGVLMTDGYISKKGEIELALKDDDAEHVDRFRLFMGSDRNIKIKLNKRGYNSKNENSLAVATVCSLELVTKLAEFNIVPRKTYTAECPEILLSNRHFWRGCIDGDGCISKNAKGEYSIGLYGTEKLCQQFLSFIKNSLPDIGVKSNVYRSSTIYGIKFGHSDYIVAIAKLLYGDSAIYLDRKKKLIEELIENVKPNKKVYILVYDSNKNLIDTVQGISNCSQKYSINYHTIYSSTARGSLCNDLYYFERQCNPDILSYIRN